MNEREQQQFPALVGRAGGGGADCAWVLPAGPGRAVVVRWRKNGKFFDRFIYWNFAGISCANALCG